MPCLTHWHIWAVPYGGRQDARLEPKYIQVGGLKPLPALACKPSGSWEIKHIASDTVIVPYPNHFSLHCRCIKYVRFSCIYALVLKTSVHFILSYKYRTWAQTHGQTYIGKAITDCKLAPRGAPVNEANLGSMGIKLSTKLCIIIRRKCISFITIQT
jgi:hypothetical protein